MLRDKYNWKRLFSIRGILSSVWIFAPMIFFFVFVELYFGMSVTNFVPRWSDEILNWHQIATFKEVGFSGGYYTFSELSAPASFTRFYSHGPVYPVMMGTLAQVMGWELMSPVIFNMILLLVTYAAFCLSTRLEFPDLVLVGFVVLTSWSIQLYMASCMRVVFFMAFSFILAVLFIRLFDKKNPSTSVVISAIVALMILCAAKNSYAVLFIPFFVAIKDKIRLGLLKSIGAGAISMLVVYYLSSALCAPYPNFVNKLASSIGSNNSSMDLFFDHMIKNISNFFSPDQNMLWLSMRFQLVVFSVYGLTVLVRQLDFQQIRERTGAGQSKWIADDVNFRVGILVFCISVGTLLGCIFFYEVGDWKDYRLFAPIVFLVCVLLIYYGYRKIPLVIIAINLITFPSFYDSAQVFYTSAFSDETTVSEIYAHKQHLTELFDYNYSGNGWENTIIAPLNIAFDRKVLAIPPGIGISWYVDPRKMADVKSKYLLLDEPSYAYWASRLSLRYLGEAGAGYLFRRL